MRIVILLVSSVGKSICLSPSLGSPIVMDIFVVFPFQNMRVYQQLKISLAQCIALD